MQITSYDANLRFFFFFFWKNLQFTWLFNIQSHYQCVFSLNLKIYRILRFTIWCYDLQSHLPLTILCRIPILTTLHTIHTEMVPRSFANVSEKSWIFLTVAARNCSIPREYLLLSVFFPRSHCWKAEKNAVRCFQFLTVPE